MLVIFKAETNPPGNPMAAIVFPDDSDKFSEVDLETSPGNVIAEYSGVLNLTVYTYADGASPQVGGPPTGPSVVAITPNIQAAIETLFAAGLLVTVTAQKLNAGIQV